jgi:hypothetical protein
MCQTLSATLHASTDDVAGMEALPVPAAMRVSNLVNLAAAREARRPLLVAGSEGGAA